MDVIMFTIKPRRNYEEIIGCNTHLLSLMIVGGLGGDPGKMDLW
jgi:hypothetical protein